MEVKSAKELKRISKELQENFLNRWKLLNLEQDKDRLKSLTEKAEDPNLWNNPEEARLVSQKKNELEKKLNPWFTIQQDILDFPDLVDLTLDEKGENGVGELSSEYNRLQEKFEELELLGALKNPEDLKPAFLNIHPGAGGTESQDWAEMLLRMYTRYFEKKGYQYSLIDVQAGDGAGIKNATLHVIGDFAFGFLKGENGVHRLVRISPFDANKRRHTSFVSVHVSPEIDDDIDIKIEEKDIRVDVYRSSGAGGQHVNTTDSAVRITHMPSGIVVACQNERSQIKNRDTAFKMLKARLYELEQEKAKEELEKKSGEKKDITWGSQIRSYVFHPYNLVKDHRTDHETGNVAAVMDGDIEPFILAYLKTL
ncbi:peptide chain release factor 2 [Leptospira interrogans]|uniref:Peptide chain release factor 2 n=6 Tax=Leptospira interrogans TaxID=173 RepID=RF2_LEPIC|nr:MULTISPECIES: peptide chain release factor 2 [Leptospira]Q72V33.1 RecName: Full=Peptide chain release factor 2; Short=RF-2 [Leptospira interrogans serovar Copenhageni str. Fiocruz L1-130]EMY06149.1 peptide chain release factor 2 [Leptospira interrogans str. 2002000626]OCC29344.1 Peptide chain release factor 2 [Leptospira interrogans serovar Canicola]AAS69091.1 peptide chain release factor 2 [Leptospira interrogans serovar Copenhageni str. Fiocruz L1-130]ARB96534.1 peptide chain release fact